MKIFVNCDENTFDGKQMSFSLPVRYQAGPQLRGVLLWLNASRGLLGSTNGRRLSWRRRETVDL
jgi:hypothetical protein